MGRKETGKSPWACIDLPVGPLGMLVERLEKRSALSFAPGPKRDGERVDTALSNHRNTPPVRGAIVRQQLATYRLVT